MVQRSSDISVVIPAYGTCPHLNQVLQALVAQSLQPREIIVVHSGPSDPTETVSSETLDIHIHHHVERLLGGAARNRGAAIAAGEWLAFIDADVRPNRQWLASLMKSIDHERRRFVVGSIGYATSGGYWGLSNWLCEFSEQAPWQSARYQTGGASCNMIVKASDFREAGGFPEEYQPGEDTMLFARLIECGLSQWFDPAAEVYHYNRAGLITFAQHQYRLGVHSALVRQQIKLRGSMATQIWPIVLILWIPRIALLAKRVASGGPKWWFRGIALAPGILFGSWIWTAGFLRQVWSKKSRVACFAVQPQERQ